MEIFLSRGIFGFKKNHLRAAQAFLPTLHPLPFSKRKMYFAHFLETGLADKRTAHTSRPPKRNFLIK